MNQDKARYQSLNKVADAILAKKVPSIVVFAHEVVGMNTGMARIVGQINHTSESRSNPDSIISGIKAAFDHKLAPILGSIKTLEEGGPYTQGFTCLVATAREALPATKSNMKQFVARASNMFADADDQLWTIENTQAGKLIVKSTGITDDLDLVNFISNSSSIPSSGQTSVAKMVALASSAYSTAKGGDFITFADMNGTINVGYIVATASAVEGEPDTQAFVLPFEESEAEVISLASIIEVHDQEGFPTFVERAEHAVDANVAIARGDFNLDMLLGYYERIYGTHPEFYRQLADRITSSAMRGA